MTLQSPSTQLREALIARLETDAGVRATALGPQPRIFNIAPPQGHASAVTPFLVIQDEIQPFDTDTSSGAEHSLSIFVMGDRMGHDEAEAIFQAVRASLRDWAPQTLSAHRLANLIFRSQGVSSEEGGKRYFGRQRWRAVTEETS